MIYFFGKNPLTRIYNIMALNDVCVKSEPEDTAEDLNLLKTIIPEFSVKLEDEILQDKPEFISLQCAVGNSIKEDSEDTCTEYVQKHNKHFGVSYDDNSSEIINGIYENNSHSENIQEESCDAQEKTESEDMSSDEIEDELTCRVCKQTFVDDFELELHFKSRRLFEKCYKCCGCEKQFRDNTQLTVHSRKHTGEQPYVCKICGKKFSVNGNLSKHLRIHTGERRYECDTCQRKFTQFAHLEDHMKTHSGDRPFICDFCNSAFKTKARLRKHKKSHEDDKVTKRSMLCPVCNKMMKSTKQLLAHMDTHDAGAPNPFSCNICGKTYKHMFSLNFHLKKHGGVREFKCHMCDKAFCNSSHLRRHIDSHTGIKPYICAVCLRGFPSQQNLKRHMMTHTGEKPFICSECNKGFLTLENLNRHKRTHTGEKPFPCNICGKFFAHSTTAKEHQRIHSGDKPFGCSICDKRFSLNKALYKHIRERHPVFFPEFKRLNDLPPNVKRAREKIKKELEEIDVKNVTVMTDVTVAVDNKSEIVRKSENPNADEELTDIPFIKVEKQEFD